MDSRRRRRRRRIAHHILSIFNLNIAHALAFCGERDKVVLNIIEININCVDLIYVL